MQSSLGDNTIDCLGRCINNLTPEDLDQITENIYKTLTHPKGNELFANYLAQFPDSLACLKVYNTCLKYLTEEQKLTDDNSSQESESLESLVSKVKDIQKAIFDIPDIDYDLMTQYKSALETNSKEALYNVLRNTKDQCQDSLRDMYERFRDHILRCKNKKT